LILAESEFGKATQVPLIELASPWCKGKSAKSKLLRTAYSAEPGLILSGAVKLTVDGRQVICRPPMAQNTPRATARESEFAGVSDESVLTPPFADLPRLLAQLSESITVPGKVFEIPDSSNLDAQQSGITAIPAK
jgi:hypothetical protein